MLALHIDDVAVAALGLAPVQRFVDQGKKRVEIPRVIREGRATDGGGDEGRSSVHREYLSQHAVFTVDLVEQVMDVLIAVALEIDG